MLKIDYMLNPIILTKTYNLGNVLSIF